MRLHRNARTCPASRRLLVRRIVEEKWSVAAARAAGISERSAWKWLARFRSEGVAGLEDRSSVPRRMPRLTPADRVEAIAALRRLRLTGAEISWIMGMPLSTVHAVLKRVGLGKLSRLDPIEPANRYERRWPGELVHIDVKKLARIDGVGHAATGTRRGHKKRTGSRRIGYEYVHVCVDDATRLAYVEVLPNERAATAIGFLRRCLAFYAARGVRVQRVMTDNGAAYIAAVWALACRTHGLRHLRTRPRRPRTNGKAERFIRTLLGGWAYGAIYTTTPNEPAACPAGSTTTITTDHTAASATSHPDTGSQHYKPNNASRWLIPN
jgi:transposase InsO family protein